MLSSIKRFPSVSVIQKLLNIRSLDPGKGAMSVYVSAYEPSGPPSDLYVRFFQKFESGPDTRIYQTSIRM